MLKNLCVQCDEVITAPDDMRGKDVACDHCGTLNVLLSAEDIAAQINQERGREQLEGQLRLGAALNEQSASVRGLRDLSDLLLLFSYLLALLVLAGGALPIVLQRWTVESQVLCFVLAAVLATLLFITFKFLSALVQALSDQLSGQIILQEQLRDVLTLLRDQEEL